MSAKIKPLGARVLVRRLEAEEKSSGGIFIPDAAKEKPQEAEVVELGTGGKDEEGNAIVFHVEEGRSRLDFQVRRHRSEAQWGSVLILKQDEILAIFN